MFFIKYQPGNLTLCGTFLTGAQFLIDGYLTLSTLGIRNIIGIDPTHNEMHQKSVCVSQRMAMDIR